MDIHIDLDYTRYEYRDDNSFRHHWIPQYYLKKWGEKPWRHFYDNSPSNQNRTTTFGKVDGFNSRPFLGGELLPPKVWDSQLEDKITSQVDGPLHVLLADFLDIVEGYNWKRRDHQKIKSMIPEILTLPSMIVSRNPTTRRYVEQRIPVCEIERSALFKIEFELWDTMYKIMIDQPWHVIRPSRRSKTTFISTDRPVICLPNRRAWIFPLSPRAALVSERYNGYKHDGNIMTVVNDDLVRSANTHLMSASSEWVISQNPFIDGYNVTTEAHSLHGGFARG